MLFICIYHTYPNDARVNMYIYVLFKLTFIMLYCNDLNITGNVWRFPYVIASNGGCAAVVAYLICAVLVAWPLFLFELILGQYLRLTFIKTWEAIRPRWLSFGWAQFLLLFIAQSYFSMVSSVINTYNNVHILYNERDFNTWNPNISTHFSSISLGNNIHVAIHCWILHGATAMVRW